MQEAAVNEQDAEQVEATWYLSRDGEQHGPLSDRELSMFAKGGNFKPGDLLWTAGLDEWKPADQIFDLAPTAAPEEAAAPEPEFDDTDFIPDVEEGSVVAEAAMAEAAMADEPVAAEAAQPAQTARHNGYDDDPLFDEPLGGEDLDGDHVGALAKALSGEAEPRKLSFQEQLTADIKVFGRFCAYLWAVFVMLTVHAVVVGAEYGAGLSFFLLTTLNAFLLMRVMPLVERNAFFQNLAHKPLIYAITYKAGLFVLGLVIMYAIEMALLGLIGIGSGALSLGGGFGGMLAWTVILFLALLPYFVFREVEGAVGADMMAKLLFRRH